MQFAWIAKLAYTEAEGNVAKQILLVEDNDIDQKAVGRALQHCYSGADLVVRPDGRQAIDLLENSKAKPDLVLLDIKLPFVNGLEVLEWIRQQETTLQIPVVMLTSSDEPNEIAKCYRLGANSYVRKIVDFEAFRKRICDIAKYWLDINVA